jgi:GNAT superfamily N-acetyltransferase
MPENRELLMTPSPPVTISPLREEHHDAWMPLWRGYQVFYETDIPAAVSAVTWTRLLDSSEPMDGALAWRDSTAIGLVHYIQHRSCWTTGNYCYLQDLFVAPSLRGAGTGRMLIEYVYEKARASGCSRVYWLTHETNTGAMQLYGRVAERSGFIQYRHLFKS